MLRYKHYILYYFFIFSSLGLVTPYLGLWVNHIANPEYVKYIMTSFYVTLIIVPFIGGYFAFSNDKPGSWLSWSTFLALICSLLLSIITSETSWIVVCLMIACFGLFFNPLLSVLEAMAYTQSKNPQEYSKIRLFGSLGFLFCSSFVGGLLVAEYPFLFPFLVSFFLFGCWLFSLPYKKLIWQDHGEKSKPKNLDDLTMLETFDPQMNSEKSDNLTHQADDRKILKDSLFKLHYLWVVSFLTQAAFACYYAFYAIRLQELGYSSVQIGTLIGISLIVEVIAFWKIDWFFKWMSPAKWLIVCGLISSLRWVVFGTIEENDMLWLLLGQMTHAVGFSVFHTSCFKMMGDHFHPRHLGSAQGFYNAVSYGLGGSVGVYLASLMWEQYGSSFVFYLACVLSLLSSLAVLMKKGRYKILNKG